MVNLIGDYNIHNNTTYNFDSDINDSYNHSNINQNNSSPNTSNNVVNSPLFKWFVQLCIRG